MSKAKRKQDSLTIHVYIYMFFKVHNYIQLFLYAASLPISVNMKIYEDIMQSIY